MNINSTEDERYEEIKDKEIKIVKWDESKEIKVFNPNISISKSLYNQANELGLIQQHYKIEGIDHPIKFNNKSLKESISSMCRQKSDLMSLSKLLTVLDEVLNNAIQIQIEEYRHSSRQISKDINCVHQYISGFYDNSMIYPVKVSVFERKHQEDSSIHVVVTVGEIKKEALPDTRVQCLSNESHESLRAGVTSFTISISEFVKFFNANESVLLKNIPNAFLSESQISIKEKVIISDIKRDIELNKIHEQKKQLKQQEKILKNAPYDYWCESRKFQKNNVSIDEY